MSKITISELEVFYCVGLTDEERAKPQRLVLNVEMSLDISSASLSDRIEKTINYHKVVESLLKFGQNRTWKLLEKLVSNLADMILAEYRPQAVMIEARKFVIPQAKYVSVTLTRSRAR